jgi:hypothetical protein
MMDYWLHKTISTSWPTPDCLEEKSVMSQQQSQEQRLDGNVPTTVVGGGNCDSPAAVSDQDTEEFYRRLTDSVKRLAKEMVFSGMQFVMNDKVLEAGGTYFKIVMKAAGASSTDTLTERYWNSLGKKVVEKTINRQRQAVVLRVKKRFAGKS